MYLFFQKGFDTGKALISTARRQPLVHHLDRNAFGAGRRLDIVAGGSNTTGLRGAGREFCLVSGTGLGLTVARRRLGLVAEALIDRPSWPNSKTARLVAGRFCVWLRGQDLNL